MVQRGVDGVEHGAVVGAGGVVAHENRAGARQVMGGDSLMQRAEGAVFMMDVRRHDRLRQLWMWLGQTAAQRLGYRQEALHQGQRGRQIAARFGARLRPDGERAHPLRDAARDGERHQRMDLAVTPGGGNADPCRHLRGWHLLGAEQPERRLDHSLPVARDDRIE